MAWVKISAENHTLFLDALPKDPRISTLKMFGGTGSCNDTLLLAEEVMDDHPPASAERALTRMPPTGSRSPCATRSARCGQSPRYPRFPGRATQARIMSATTSPRRWIAAFELMSMLNTLENE